MAVEKRKLNLVDEKTRLGVKSIADEVRIEWSKKGLFDIFAILDNAAIFIRRPLNTTKISGFTTFFNDNFAVLLNSSFSLGHERYSAAHELYHLTQNKEILRQKKLLLDESNETEQNAQVFAAEFLMPEDGIKELFFKRVDVSLNEISPRHIIRMMYAFKVSYAAMLKRLIQLGLCNADKYDYLRGFSDKERADELQSIIIKEGFEPYLVVPSKASKISEEYIDIARSNFEKGIISYGKLEELLQFIGKCPKDYGYSKVDLEDE